MKALERLALAVMALLTTAGAALQGARPQPVGTVVGHVTCSDTQRPARLAQVKLVRVPTAVDRKPAGAGQTIREDVVLDRGASVSGTILDDDGTPASGVGIDLLVKGADGKWMRRERTKDIEICP